MIRRATQNRRQQFAFTLIELMIAMAIGLLLLGGLVVVFTSSQNAVREAQDLSRFQENLRFASDFVVRDIRNAGFRDEANLLISEWEEIGSSYVNIGEGFLEVRYAGRGSCNEDFGAIGVAINRYEVQNNVLLCNGDRLVSGVTGLSARPIYPSAAVSQTCPGTCIGVILDITFDGGRSGPVPLALKAIFRNPVLEALFAEEVAGT